MPTSDIMTPESRPSSGSPAAPAWVVRRRVAALAILAFLAASPGGKLPAQQAEEPAQETAESGSGLIYQRKVQLPQGPAFPAIVMTEFFTNSELPATGGNLVVQDGRHNLVPWRILQLGPGDFSRIAFQTVPKQHLYKIYYGGKAEPEKPPAWTDRAGLLLETRHWTNCDLGAWSPCARPSRRLSRLAVRSFPPCSTGSIHSGRIPNRSSASTRERCG